MATDNRIKYLIDNQDGRTLESVFERLAVDEVDELLIAVGYFHVSGFNIIRQHLGKVKKIRLIIGTDTDEPTKNQLSRGYQDRITESISADIDNMENSESGNLMELCEYISTGKIDVRVYVKTKFHAKAYIFKRPTQNSNLAVVGSSNMSMRGLGKDDESNTELNVVQDDTQATELVDWFEDIWKQTEEYNDKLIKIIKTSRPIIAQFDSDYVSPRELFRIIACEYNSFPSRQKDMLSEFQQVGVIVANDVIERFHGCIVADSVGLGKTFIGLRLIEQAQAEGKNVLLIVPKSVKGNWGREMRRYFRDIIKDENRLKIMTTTELSNFDLANPDDRTQLDEIGNKYQFVVMDEAHRFRNRGEFDEDKVVFNEKKKKYDGGYSGRKRYANIRYLHTEHTGYLLLTATPLNNSIFDMENLLSIFTTPTMLKNDNPELKFEKFAEYRKLDRDITEMSRNPKDNTIEEKNDIEEKKRLRKDALDDINRILNEVMVLRTKKNIIDDYGGRIGDTELIREIPKVVKTDYPIDAEYSALYAEVETLITGLKIPHIRLTKKEQLGKLLEGLYKILLFKRMESSIHSFVTSLKTLEENEKAFKEKVEKDGLLSTISEKRDISNIMDTDSEISDLIEEMDSPTDDDGEITTATQEAINNVNDDLELIKNFRAKCSNIIRSGDMSYKDPKLEKVKSMISAMIGQKVLIFTQYADTAEYLYNKLSSFAKDYNKVLDCVVGDPSRKIGDSGLETETKIRLFAPKANDVGVGEGTEIDILIATDSLSEGVNMQDCSIIINYDLPWNPMRIVQRVGRVDRIHSTARTTVFNIVPDKELETFLSLLEKLEKKIENVTKIVGKENYILSEDEEIDNRTIGARLKEARASNDYRTFEGKTDNLAGIRTNDAQGRKIYNLRQLMDKFNLSCKKEDNGEKRIPYTIIQENMGQYAFVLFRVYDKIKNSKMENIIIVKDILASEEYGGPEPDFGEYDKMELDDRKIIRLPNVFNGVNKGAITKPDFKLHTGNIIEYFENNKLQTIIDRYNASITLVDDSRQAGRDQQYVIHRLVQVTDIDQTSFTDNLSKNEIALANKCKKLLYRALKRSDASRLKKWYGNTDASTDGARMSNTEFIQRTNEFVEKYVTEANGYTKHRNKEDVGFVLVCMVMSA